MTIAAFWLLFSLISFLAELSSPGMFYFFSCSIVSFGLALWNYYAELSLLMQGIVFTVGCFAIFFLLHFFMKKMTTNGRQQYISHIVSLINREGTALTEIAGTSSGQIVVHNEIWPAYSANKEQIINRGDQVVVIGIKGVHLIIKAKEKS